MKEENPLVSIIVITYNSAKYVLETLESVKAQTYQNIELIVSDDSSSDDTVEICRKWMEDNKQRLVRTELITVNENTGIPANCNRGIKSSQGEWIKLIAGDDILFPEAVEKLLLKIKTNNQIELLVGNVFKFTSPDLNNGQASAMEKLPFFNHESSSIDQYQYLLRYNRLHAPGAIIKRVVFEKIGYFNEDYRLLEDYPFWLKATENGIRIYCTPDIIVYYRFHENTTSQGSDNSYKVHPVENILIKFQLNYILIRLPLIEGVGLLQKTISNKLIIALGNKRDDWFINLIFNIFKYTNSFSIYRGLLHLFKRRYSKEKYI